MTQTLEIIVSALICIEIALICIRFADKGDKIIAKLSKLDTKNAKKIAEELFKSQATKDFLYDVAYNLLSHAIRAGIMKPYMDDFYKSFKGHVLSSGGHAAKLKKKATKEVLEYLIEKEPIGQYASMIIGKEQIHEMLGTDEDPNKALEKLKIIMGMLKKKGQYTQQ